jgi:hypothetical protein
MSQFADRLRCIGRYDNCRRGPLTVRDTGADHGRSAGPQSGLDKNVSVFVLSGEGGEQIAGLDFARIGGAAPHIAFGAFKHLIAAGSHHLGDDAGGEVGVHRETAAVPFSGFTLM